MEIEDIKSIGVLGGGVMGSGIAQTAILAGYRVIVCDLSNSILTKTKDTIVNGRFGLMGGINRGKHSQEQVNRALTNLTLTTSRRDLRDCEIIIESIGGSTPGELENKNLKKQVFGQLDKLVKGNSIFTSNTSYYTIADLIEGVERKDKFIGMHWFGPANIMKAVELIYTSYTSEETIQILEALCDRLGKTGVRVKDIPGDTGFIANRIGRVVIEEARRIVEEGIASSDAVDTVMKGGYNWPAGPFEWGQGIRDGWA